MQLSIHDYMQLINNVHIIYNYNAINKKDIDKFCNYYAINKHHIHNFCNYNAINKKIA
jgi:uncharacterized radical SAM superfamily Fe-S cluster-containing enzyme